jgi:hypothetical protein
LKSATGDGRPRGRRLGGAELRLKQLVIFILLTALAQLSVAAQARGARRAPKPAAEAFVGIEAIDFENYTYALGGRSYKLIGGYYAGNSAPDAQWELRVAETPYYGDLTGDGRSEAVVVLSYGPVGGAHAVEARVYTLRGGSPVLLVTLPVADALSCELDHYVDLDDGKLRVERVYGRDGRCDHNEVTEFRWDGKGFMPVGEAKMMRCRCM